MKYYIANDLGCVYRLNDNELEFAPLSKSQCFDDEEFYPVEPDLIGEEFVNFKGVEVSLYEVFEFVKRVLRGGY